MSKKIYCGIGPIPKGKRLGLMRLPSAIRFAQLALLASRTFLLII